MKGIIAMGVLFSFAAMAEVKLPGTFIPHLCGDDKSVSENKAYDVDRVCIGKVSDFNYQAVEIRFTAEQTEMGTVLKIVSQKPTNGGINPNYTAKDLTLQDSWGRTSKARLEQVRIDSKSNETYISGRTPDGIEFSSTAMEIMFVTM